MSGLETTGFVPETTDDILTAIQTDQRALIADDIDTSAEELIGELNSIMTTKLEELWQLGKIVYDARRPAGASFTALDDLCAITGTTREGSTFGLVTLSVTLGPGITLPAGSVAAVVGQPTNRWATTLPATNPSGSPATLSVQARATTAGRIVANANTITQIGSPVAGWTAVNNPLDAAPGHGIETDPQLRTRRETELSKPGTGTIPAMEADLAGVTVNNVSVVAAVVVQENASAFTDVYGRPPNTVEAIVQFTPGLTGPDLDNARQAFANQLWLSTPGGIYTFGAHSDTVIDSRGNSQTLFWTEPTDLAIYVAMTLQIDPTAYPGDTQAKAIVTAFGDTMRLGGEVIRNRLLTDLMEMPGVIDVIVLNIGIGAATGSVNIQPNARQLAQFDTAHITVVTTQ